MNQVGFVNAALRLIGCNPVGAMNDASAEARVATALYPVAYAEALSGYPWSFGKVDTVQLSKDPNETPDERERYALPADWMSLTRVYEGSSGVEIGFELVGNYLVTNDDVSDNGIYARYVKHVNEGQLPPYFHGYLVELLAAWFAMPLTESNSIAEAHRANAEKLRREAEHADAMSSGTKRLASLGEYSMIAGR